MKKNDLTQVKNIGSARKKLLASHGITTVQQLYDIPLEKLEQIKNLGKHYAKLIKEAVNDVYRTKEKASAEPSAEVSSKQNKKLDKIDNKLLAEMAKTGKYLKGAREKFKPINKKKHLKLFVDLKKQSNKLKTEIVAMHRIYPDLSEKHKKKIKKKATALNLMIKNVGPKKKGKTMKKLNAEIQSFLNLLGK